MIVSIKITLHAYWTLRFVNLSVLNSQSSSLQVAVESLTDQHHADGNAEQCGPDATLET
jgi:hypothetical protein